MKKKNLETEISYEEMLEAMYESKMQKDAEEESDYITYRECGFIPRARVIYNEG